MARAFNARPIAAINRFPRIGIFLIYLLIWTGVNWPALGQTWWVNDDHAILVRFDPQHNLQLGRPLEAFQHWTLTWETGERGWLNPSLRYGQGILHAAVATLAAWLLYQATHRRFVFFAMLLFLIWPFHGEAVLWRASAIPLGALLSMVGPVLLMHRGSRWRWLRTVIGVIAVALAVLTHQLAALAALVVWLLLFSLARPAQVKRLWQLLLLLLAGYVLGAGASLWFIQHYSQSMGRASLATDWLGKALLMVKLNGLLLVAREFPIWLIANQLLLLVSAALLFAYVLCGQRRSQLWRPGLGLAGLLILPYAPLLVIAEDSLAPRNLYFGSFLLIGAALLVEQLAIQHFIHLGFNRLLIVVLVLLLGGYSLLAWRSSSEFVTLYQRDRATLQQIEQQIISQGGSATAELAIATAPGYLRTWNPYALPLMWGDAKKSAFLVEWAAPALVRHCSTLTPTTDPLRQNQCTFHCQQQRAPVPFALVRLQAQQWCLCP